MISKVLIAILSLSQCAFQSPAGRTQTDHCRIPWDNTMTTPPPPAQFGYHQKTYGGANTPQDVTQDPSSRRDPGQDSSQNMFKAIHKLFQNDPATKDYSLTPSFFFITHQTIMNLAYITVAGNVFAGHIIIPLAWVLTLFPMFFMTALHLDNLSSKGDPVHCLKQVQKLLISMGVLAFGATFSLGLNKIALFIYVLTYLLNANNLALGYKHDAPLSPTLPAKLESIQTILTLVGGLALFFGIIYITPWFSFLANLSSLLILLKLLWINYNLYSPWALLSLLYSPIKGLMMSTKTTEEDQSQAPGQCAAGQAPGQ